MRRKLRPAPKVLKLAKRGRRGENAAMRKTMAAGLLAAAALGMRAGQVTQPSVAGDWAGAIHVAGTEIPIAVHLQGQGAAWAGTFDQPAQGAIGIPLKDIVVDGEKVSFGLARVPGSPKFEGRLAGGTISGTFSQGGGTGTFDLRPGRPKSTSRPQDPVPPFPYAETEVTVKVKDGVTLAGTLTIPGGEAPKGGWPAAVLITGSGPQNRNEELLGHRPFLVLADALARAGVAVLRCDDRGVARSTGIFAIATTADFTDDAAANVAFLRGRPEVNSGKVGVVGHSEGGLIGPALAARDPKVAFVVMLAGPGIPGREVIESQLRAMVVASGAPAAEVERSAETEKRVLDAIIANDVAGARKVLMDAVTEKLGPQPSTKLPEPARKTAEANVNTQVAQLSSPWFRYFLTTDPQASLRKVKVPVLALNGTLDTQVLVDKNLPQVEKALREGGNADVTAKALPGLNHLFQHAKTGLLAEYGQIDETMSPEVLELVPDWINARFGAGVK